MNAHSLDKNSYFQTNFKLGLQNKKLWVILAIVNVLSVPYAVISMALFHNDSVVGLAVSAIALVINVIMGMVIPFLRFDYLYNRTKVDMVYAMPLTRKERFLSDFLSGLAMYVIGFFGQIVLSNIVTVIVMQFNPNFLDTYFGYRLVNGATLSERIDLLGMENRILIIILLFQIMLYVVTTLVLTLVGAVFEAVSAIIYTNILLVSSIYVINILCMNQLYGMDFTDTFINIIFCTSPLGGFLYLTNLFSKASGFWGWVICYLLVTVIYFGVAYFCFMRRKAEDVGKSFVYKVFYHIILIAVMLHIGLLAYYAGNFILTFLLATLIFYLVMEVVTNRGFKKFKQSIIRYASIIAVTLGVILVINKTDCFGLAYRVSKPESIANINISYHGLVLENEALSVNIKSEENIEKIISVQKNLLEDYKKSSNENETGFFDLGYHIESGSHPYRISNWIDLNFNPKNANTYHRDYSVYYPQMTELLEVELSDEYLDQMFDYLERCSNSLKVSDVYRINQKVIVEQRTDKTKDVLKKFYDCLKSDLKETTKEEFLRPKQNAKYRVDTEFCGT